MSECPRFDLDVALAAVLRRAAVRWAAEPFAAFVVDMRDPLGAIVVEMIALLGCGVFHRYAGPELHERAEGDEEEAAPCEGRRFVVGAASLADVRTIVMGLAAADRGLGESSGAAALDRTLSAKVGTSARDGAPDPLRGPPLQTPLLVCISSSRRWVRRLRAGFGPERRFAPRAEGHA